MTRASCAELGGAAIDLAACLLYSEAQYAAAGEWNARQRAARELVPRRLDSAEPIDWTPVWSLASRERRYLPSAYCYYGHPEAALAFCFADSNGCAAGPTLEAAVRSGLMELIERDAVAIWWYNRLSRPEIDTASFDLPFADQLRSYYRTVGRDLVVLDLTHDIGVPVFAGISARLDGGAEEIMLGFGADLDPKVALARALRELAQFHPIVAQRNARGETIYTTGNEDAIDWLRTGRRAQNPHLAPSQAPKRTAAQFVTRPGADPLADVGACVHALAKVGIEPFVCVQTRPDIDIPVARVVAPGLRHFWRRLAPGRLFGVPAAMGWADRPLHEHELNPVAIFF